MSSDVPRTSPRSREDICGASHPVDGLCTDLPTHEVEAHPDLGVTRRCETHADTARDRWNVDAVRPITLDVDVDDVAAAIDEYYRYTRAPQDRLDYVPAVRVDPDVERLEVARGSLIEIPEDSTWRRPSALLTNAPRYADVTRPAWSGTREWLDAVSACVRQTITVDGREWSLPTNEIALALRARANSNDGDGDDGDAAPALIADGGIATDDQLRLTDQGLELPEFLKGYSGKFDIRTAPVTGTYTTTDAGMPTSDFYDGPIAVYPDEEGTYNADLAPGYMAISTPDHEERVYEIVDERSDDQLVADGGRDRQAFLDGNAHYCDICSTSFQSLKELANHNCVATDGGTNPGSSASRLREVRKQLSIVLEDVDDESVEDFARKALGCAESAAVCLEGPGVLADERGQRNSGVPMVVDEGRHATSVAGPDPAAHAAWEARSNGGDGQ